MKSSFSRGSLTSQCDDRSALGALRKLLFAVMAVATAACASVNGTSDRDVVATYRLFARGSCEQLLEEIAAIDWSQESATRRPFFELIQAYCLELAGDLDAARRRYGSVIDRSPATHQAFEASLRLAALEPAEVSRRERFTTVAIGKPPYEHSAKPVHRTTPEYPSALLGAHIEGWVVVDYALSSSGSVSDPFVLQSYPPFIFDGSALSAVRHWIYEPTANPRTERRSRVRMDFELRQ